MHSIVYIIHRYNVIYVELYRYILYKRDAIHRFRYEATSAALSKRY